ncbi:MAG: hypothetical protein OXJ52_01465, partial [Oligoflexia bacterium]|nr:hypothetical protein [Oligoflexia bacterium]
PRQSQLPTASRRALAVSVVDQLFQYDLLTKEQRRSFIRNKDLFPKEWENPFVIEVKLNLAVADETQAKRLVESFKKGKIKEDSKKLILRSLSRKYLQTPSKNLEDLQTVADSMNLDNESEVMTFFSVLHTQFSNYTQEQREGFIAEYSQKSSKNLEELLLWYADTNFTPDRKKEICMKLRSGSTQNRSLGYVCKG